MVGKRSRPIRRTTSMTLLGAGRRGSIPPLPEHPEGRPNPPVVATFGAPEVVSASGNDIVSLTQSPEIIQGQQFDLPNGVGNVHPDGPNRCMIPGTAGMLPDDSSVMSVEAVSAPKQQDVCMQFETESANRDSIPSTVISPPSARLPDSSQQSPHGRHRSSNGHNFSNQSPSRKKNFPQAPFHNVQDRPPSGSQNTEWDQYAGTLYSSPVSCAEGRIEGAAPIPPVDFLDACFLCKRRLGNGRDIYMYRGDRAFCSVECRHHQIVIDERREKCSLTVATKPNTAPARHTSHNGKAVPTGTAAAA